MLRADLDDIPAYLAGRTVPGSITLASNEISLPPPAPVLAAITEAAEGGNRYPDPAVTGLTGKLARHYDVAPEQVAVGCGSVMLCQQLVQIECGGPGRRVVSWTRPTVSSSATPLSRTG
ncbi:hypothetical protein [Pseudonocardia spinosispora]|uniref:hypothetical protein n=1 Tax=Pseudonocardia spinosispora TaxID=103441 RepID=UPI001FE22CF1|nr:hypothetical protein [Pseudonocardia spinosispora]